MSFYIYSCFYPLVSYFCPLFIVYRCTKWTFKASQGMICKINPSRLYFLLMIYLRCVKKSIIFSYMPMMLNFLDIYEYEWMNECSAILQHSLVLCCFLIIIILASTHDKAYHKGAGYGSWWSVLFVLLLIIYYLSWLLITKSRLLWSTTAAEKLRLQQQQLSLDQQPLKLVNDVVTRWNSTYYMLQRILQVYI